MKFPVEIIRKLNENGGVTCPSISFTVHILKRVFLWDYSKSDYKARVGEGRLQMLMALKLIITKAPF